MGRKLIDRTGEIKTNKTSLGNYKMKIIKCDEYSDIVVEFQDKHKTIVHTNYNSFKNGIVKNPYHPSVFGIGYLGQGKYKSRGEDGNKTKAYSYWQRILERCYNPYFINEHLTYIDCFVCDEWHNFQNFAEWFYKHYYEIENERMELDKDILFKGNKVYSPKTCIFVPQRINVLFTKNDTNRGKYPIGVSSRNDRNKLLASCCVFDEIKGKKIQKRLGLFPLDKPFQAFYVYKQFKENYIKQVANEYKNLIPKKLYDALYRYEVEIND